MNIRMHYVQQLSQADSDSSEQKGCILNTCSPEHMHMYLYTVPSLMIWCKCSYTLHVLRRGFRSAGGVCNTCAYLEAFSLTVMSYI